MTKRLLISLSSIAALALASISSMSHAADYQVGERLPQKSAPPATHYRALNWDEMLPADWDPMEPLKGLNLDELEDSDPRAMEALKKVREAWNRAPTVASLDKQRVEIPGFVVPLDAEMEGTGEFLLVPYFGACIHVPPPPSNQVIHVIPPKTMTKKQQKTLRNAATQYGAISVSGMLEIMTADTAMGFSSYRITAHRLDEYKAPDQR